MRRGSEYFATPQGNDNQDVQTGFLGDEETIDWGDYDYNDQQPQGAGYDEQQPQPIFEIYAIGPVKPNNRWDLQMLFLGTGQDCIRVLIGIGDVGDKNFIKVERWFQDIPPLEQGIPDYFYNLEQSIENIYNTMLSLNVDSIHTEWINQ